jgi:flagellar assembly protein FliH
MSLSDEKHDSYESGAWKPLVPSDLDHFDREVVSGPDMDDPEVAKAFRALYERTGEEEARPFSLLYGPRREFEKQKDEPEIHPEIPEEFHHEPAPEEQAAVDPGPDPELIRQEAFAQGFAQGKEEGFRAGVDEARERGERLSAILVDVEDMWDRIVRIYEEKIVELVGRAAEKVVYGKVETDKEVVSRAILSAFEQIKDPVSAVIYVNPLDYEYMEIVKEDFFERIKGLKQVTLISDHLISPGGCRIETPSGEVSTSIEERLEAVKRCIMDLARA